MGINLLAFLMQELSKHDAQFEPLFGTLMLMAEAEDSSIDFSCGNIGVTATSNKIEIVDIDAGVAIAALELKLSKPPVEDEPDPCDRCNRPICHGCEHCK